MKNKILNLFVIFSVLAFLGCKTGGKKLSSNSSGIVKVIAPSWRATDDAPQAKRQSNSMPPSKLVPQKITNRIAVITIPKISPSASIDLKKWSNSSTEASLPPLSDVEIKLLPPVIMDAKSVRIAMNVRPISKGNPNKTVEIVAIEEKGERGLISLWAYYIIAFTILFLAWVVYDIYRDHKKIKNELKAPKKKASKKKASKKKASKKKVSKKKASAKKAKASK